ncbi:daptide biosynthesis intramembrane metalloprotease [Thermobifida fusca]|uniref:daptide biosynthesis intramembrane metalloprotease n=1 Tax=Thermobifida fusca TaxID=2021 RepID=UPI00156B45E7|nr:daptide biosynthesis intramembrane metalloprotease [Thermobifida fusca]
MTTHTLPGAGRRTAATRPAPSDTSQSVPERPRLAEDVVVHPPADGEAHWVVQRGSRYFRIGADVARLMQALDGQTDAAGLADRLGRPWTAENVHSAVRSLHERGLLDDGRVLRRTPWVVFVPPMTVQFTLVRPERLLQWLRPLIVAAANRVTATLAAAVALGGVLALAAQAADLGRAMGEPLPLGVYAGVVAAFLASTSLHELGHGVTLTYYGGRPTRIGVMLFYLAPAFFCDVSDGWRLRREHRVRVALAGIATQAVIAGAAAFTTFVVDHPDVRAGILVFSVVAYAAGLLNLIPFVKLDGYLALMSHLDLPYLRDRAMAEARAFLARILFGGRREPGLGRWWSVPFGLACMAFPVYLVTTALALWFDLFHRVGAVGITLVVCGLGFLGYAVFRGVRRLIRQARRTGARPWRIALGSVLLGGAAALALLLPVPCSATGAYVVDGDRAELVLLTDPATGEVAAGQQVELIQGGMVVETQVGAAVVESSTGAETTAPLAAFVPITLDPEVRVPAVGYEIRVTDLPPHQFGIARVHLADLPLWEFLYRSYLVPLLDW